MALAAGTRLGAYEITGLLGVGGMGEVYRARDTKLNRDVAIKILLPAVANDPDRLSRFTREAHVLASLNHPNIGHIHGIEDADGTRALVMELVEGPTLADRLDEGAIALDEALSIAGQIALALDAAHERGIIHRDLKPGNIKVRSDGAVKILDFGIAKATGPLGTNPSQSLSTTVTEMRTQTGMILGTPGYMSPEQASGRALDKRTDMWAFGCVLYEMLTGRQAFVGENASDTLAQILTRAPDWDALPADTPATIRRLLRRTMEKDPKRRLDSAAVAGLEIHDALSPPAGETDLPVPPRRSRALVSMAAVAGTAVITAAVAWVLLRPTSEAPEPPASRFSIVPTSASPLNVSGLDRNLALSPDGRYLVYRAGGSLLGGSPLIVRPIDQLDARPLPGISNAFGPFFSPDGRWIGFFDGGELKKMPIEGGPAITLCRINGRSLGAGWADDNTIVFATTDESSGLWRVSAEGGEPAALTTPSAVPQEGGHRFPSTLPDGRGVLFTISAGQVDDAQVAVFDLETAQTKTLIRGASDAEYVKTGHLIYAAAGALRAVRFDLATLTVLSDPVSVVDSVMMTANGAANYAISQTGTLAYVPAGASAVTTSPRSLVWVDRNGREEPIKAPPRPYGVPRLSPDGARVAVELLDQENDIWIWDFNREALTRLTFDAGFDVMPLWTPDSRRVIFASTRAGVPNLYAQAASGAGPVDRLATSERSQMATSSTPDGKNLFGFEDGRVIVVPLAAGGSPSAVARPLFNGGFPEASPDGRYLAYQSAESGRNEVYVRPLVEVDGGRWQVSSGGGTRPVWASSGRELFYLDESQRLTVVPVEMSGSTFTAGNPVRVLDTSFANPFPARWYDVSQDGQRFLMVKDNASASSSAPPSMVVVEHWFGELNARVPTN
jgi:serine/threonine-protein kinase